MCQSFFRPTCHDLRHHVGESPTYLISNVKKVEQFKRIIYYTLLISFTTIKKYASSFNLYIKSHHSLAQMMVQGDGLWGRKPDYPEKTHVVEQVMMTPFTFPHDTRD